MVLRELFLKLGLDVDEAAFAKGQLAAGLIESALHKAVEVAEKMVESFVDNTREAIEYGDRIRKTSQAIGIATGALQELQYAGKLADLGAEEMSQSIGILSRKMQEAKGGSEETAKAFKGIGFQEGGKLKATEEVLGNIADQFSRMPDGPEKTARAMQLFGRAGKQMIPLLNKGRDHLEEMRKEAHELGLVMDDEAVKASEELNDNLKRLSSIAQGLWRGAVAPLIPAMNELVEHFLKWRKENAEILRQKLSAFIRLIVKGFSLLVDVLDVVTASLKYIDVFMPMIAAGVTALTFVIIYLKREAIAAGIATAIAWAPIVLIFGVIAAAVAAVMLLLEDFAVYQKGGKSLFGAFANKWDDFIKVKPDDWGPVKMLKEMLQLLGKAEEIIDDIGFFFEGSKYTENKFKRKHADQFNQQGDYVGRQDKFIVPNTAGERTGVRRRGQMSIDGKVVRDEGSTTGDLNAGKYSPTLPGAEMRSGDGGSTINHVNVNAPVSIDAHQKPGEDTGLFAKLISEGAGKVIQQHVDNAIAGGKQR